MVSESSESEDSTISELEIERSTVKLRPVKIEKSNKIKKDKKGKKNKKEKK